MFLFGRKPAGKEPYEGDADVAKLFFDTFSKRVTTVEEGLKKLAKDLNHLHMSVDRSQVSDLVLLERLQKAEATLEESLGWIKTVAQYALNGSARNHAPVETRPEAPQMTIGQPVASAGVPMRPQGIAAPWEQSTSLPFITTPTELQVLSLLSEQGPKSAPEIGRLVGRSREHSARLMKKLFQEGYVNRDQTRIPFRYAVVERVRASFKKPEKKAEERQEAAAAA